MADAPSAIFEDTHVEDSTIARAERDVLRGLAERVAQLAARPVEQEKRKLWTLHNDLRKTRPLIFCDPENGWKEIITQDQLQCTHPLPRQWEHRLRKEAFWGESMNDDRVIEPWFNLGLVYSRSDWGMHEVNVGGEDGGARRWISPLKDLSDLSMLKFQKIQVDRPATDRLVALARDTFGDLLPPRVRASWYWTLGLTGELIKLRGLGQFMMDLCDNPEGVHRLMAFLRDGTMDMVSFLENNGLYTLNNEGDYVGSGGFGWTAQLPSKDYAGRARAGDLWCLSESQETVSVSPRMFEEFVFEYQMPIMERFGLVCYGCCEPVHERWGIIKRIRNLRRVSVSPWCDRQKMAEYLQDRYVYSLKPAPSLLAAERFDEEAVRQDARDALAKARGCHLELIMKDNNTIRNEPQRVVRWVQIVREEIERQG